MEQQLNDFATGLISLLAAPFIAIAVLAIIVGLAWMIRNNY